MGKKEIIEDRGDEFEDLDEVEEEEDETYLDDDEDDDGEEPGLDEEDVGEEEDEGEDEDEGEEEEGEGDLESEAESRIPRSRLNQVLRQRDAERDRVERLEAQIEKLISRVSEPVPKKEEPEDPPYDFATAESDYIELIIDGETAKAAALRQRIEEAREKKFSKEFSRFREDAVKDAVKTSETSRDAEKFDLLIESYVEKYSFLDDQSDNYDADSVETINATMAGYLSQGKTKSQALKLAVDRLAPKLEKILGYKQDPKQKKTLGDRKVKTLRKAAKASSAQPPQGKGKKAGAKDLDTINISKMSEKDFGSLSEREKKILRGD